jgi:hypothetical protein
MGRRWPGAVVLAGLAVLAAGGAAAQTARLHVLADSVWAGERFEIAVAVDHGPGRQVFFPKVPVGDAEAGPLLAFGDAEALAVRRLPPVVRGPVRTDSAVYTVAAFAADSALVGPVVAALVAAGDTAEVRTGTAVVAVRSSLEGPPPHAPAPIGPPEDFPSPAPLWAALGALAAVLLGAAAWLAVRRLRQPGAPPAPVAPYPAALAALDALDAEAPQTPAEVEAHAVAVRGVVRTYLARRLGVPALEATTGELDAALRADPRVPESVSEAVRSTLLPTDLVAFAAHRPAPDVLARLRADARAAVGAAERGARDEERGEGQEGNGAARLPHPAAASPLPPSP